MLLSRLAQNVFWLGRYVERAEDMARAIVVHDQLCMDMPKALSPGWGPLLQLCGDDIALPRIANLQQQEQVLGFLVLDESFAGSVISTLGRAREDLRTSRPLVPKEAWNTLNAAYLALHDASLGRTPSGLVRVLELVMAACQQVSAQISGTMTHDDAFGFVRTGRYLERADMLLRVMSVAHEFKVLDSPPPFEDVRWKGLLGALGAYQMYRRAHHGRADARRSVAFLLAEARFPRSLAHSLEQVQAELERLPRSERLALQVREIRDLPLPKEPSQPRAFAEHVLSQLAELTLSIERTYFN